MFLSFFFFFLTFSPSLLSSIFLLLHMKWFPDFSLSFARNSLVYWCSDSVTMKFLLRAEYSTIEVTYNEHLNRITLIKKFFFTNSHAMLLIYDEMVVSGTPVSFSHASCPAILYLWNYLFWTYLS